MASISKIILLLLFLIFPFGQLLRLNISGLDFPLIDIFIVLLALTNLFLSLPRPKIKNHYFLYFILFAWTTFVINFFIYHYPIQKPLFYLIRLTSLLSLFIFPIKLKLFTVNLKKTFFLCLISTILFGLIQYIFWPDFTFFNSFNWDPHLYRLVGSFFDPTFTALIYLFFIIQIYFSPTLQYKNIYLLISYIAFSLTYSRSTYLSFLTVAAFISYLTKKSYFFFKCSLLLIFTILILPRQAGEGTRLERWSSVKAKIINYQEGLNIFLKSPIIGHGYNNIYYVRQINKPSSHANFAFDSSLLTILVSTGLIGFGLFSKGLILLFQSLNPTRKSFFLALLIHSLFANSLLYPWILFYLALPL